MHQSTDDDHLLGIDIGGTKLAVGLFRNGRLLNRQQSATDRNGGPAWMMNEITTLSSAWIEEFSIKRCGVGFGGPVDYVKQRIICSTHVDGWTDFDLVGELRTRLELNSIVDRDTMVGALGEGLYGAGINVRPLLYLTVSTGIGGGLLTEHGLYHGADSFSCEVGHQTIDPDGPECLCGSRGCLERLCSGLWLERDHGVPASGLFKNPAFVLEYVKPLARGLKTCIMLLNPARIVIGGGISKAGDSLFVPLRRQLGLEIPTWSKASVDVMPAALGDDTILYGACALAQHLVT